MSRLFELRVIIGGLFLVYGVILTVTGAVDNGAQLAKAQGVRINLWTGLVMLAIGVVFLAWGVARPDNPDQES